MSLKTMINVLVRLCSEDLDYDALDEYYSRHEMELFNFVKELRETMGTNIGQRWELVPAGRVIKIWKDYAKMGFVRDEKGIDAIAERVVNNIIKLEINTIMAGHTQHSPEDKLKNAEIAPLTDEEDEWTADFIREESKNGYLGQWRISDYALDPLMDIAYQLLKANKTAEEKLILIDRAFNVVHQRSDIAGLFIEGGSKTLNYLAYQGTDGEEKLVSIKSALVKLCGKGCL